MRGSFVARRQRFQHFAHESVGGVLAQCAGVADALADVLEIDRDAHVPEVSCGQLRKKWACRHLQWCQNATERATDPVPALGLAFGAVGWVKLGARMWNLLDLLPGPHQDRAQATGWCS